MSNRIPVKSLSVGDFFYTDQSPTIYRVKGIDTGNGVTRVTYVILDGGNYEWEFIKPALASVTRLDPFC